jgi:hypothetical protein
MRGLPWWFWFAVAVVKFWFVTIPLAVALTLAARYGAPWLGGMRWVLIAAVALLTLPFPAAALVVIYQSFDANRYRRTLVVAETVGGLTVPAGSKVCYADKTHSIPVSIELPRATEINGMRLTGTLTPWKRRGNVATHWGGDLAEDQRLDGLPCRSGRFPLDRAGGVIFDEAGIIHRCTLASEHELLGLTLPTGTTVSRGNAEMPWSLLLPGHVGVYIPALAAMAPGGVTLDVANNGRLVRIGSGHGQTIFVRGVPLNSKTFELHGEAVVSELGALFAVAGEMRPVGTAVRIDLATGKVTVSSQ